MTTVRFLFITANVGSLFEEATKLQCGWMNEILKLIQKSRPLFIALHFQEIGGKDFEKCMDQVIGFINNFYAKCSELGFTNGRAYIDDDFESNDKFTALGSLYLMHKDLSNVCVYNFQSCNFEPVSNFKLFTRVLENEATVKRQRFPKAMFPLFKWSRKGFMRTRWKIHQKIFNLVNIHLFHDACNFIAAEQSPSVYSGHRKQALQYALNIVEERDTSPLPTFIFGDFNFRLDTRSLVENLTPATEQTSVKDSGQRLVKMEYKDGTSSECVLRIGSKVFEHSNHEMLSQMNLVDFDKELLQFPDLKEIRRTFPPSYPFCEDVAYPTSYMKTRPPAWCDRILMNSQAWNLVLASPNKASTDYNLLGRNICMGDHKPVYLLTDISLNEISGSGSASGEQTNAAALPPLQFYYFGSSDECLFRKDCSRCSCRVCACRCCTTTDACSTRFVKSPTSSVLPPCELATRSIVLCNSSSTCTNQTDDLKSIALYQSASSSSNNNVNNIEKMATNRFTASSPATTPFGLNVFLVNTEPFLYKPEICINPEMDFVTTITLYDDNTVSVMDASSYGLSMSNKDGSSSMDSRSIWWLTEQIKRSFSNFSDVSTFLDPLRQMSSCSSLPYIYHHQRLGVKLTKSGTHLPPSRIALDISESESLSSEKFGFLQCNKDGAVADGFLKRRSTFKENDVNAEFDATCYKENRALLKNDNKMRIRIERAVDGGGGWRSGQYSSIITVEGEGGEPEIVYGKPKMYDCDASNLTFTRSSNVTTTARSHDLHSKCDDNVSLSLDVFDEGRRRVPFGYDDDEVLLRRRRLPLYGDTSSCFHGNRSDENLTFVNRVEISKSSSYIFGSGFIDPSTGGSVDASDRNGFFEERFAHLGNHAPGRRFFDNNYGIANNSDYLRVDWWAVNFLNSFDKSSHYYNRNSYNIANPSTYPFVANSNDARPNKTQRLPCCRFL